MQTNSEFWVFMAQVTSGLRRFLNGCGSVTAIVSLGWTRFRGEDQVNSTGVLMTLDCREWMSVLKSSCGSACGIGRPRRVFPAEEDLMVSIFVDLCDSDLQPIAIVKEEWYSI